MGMGAHRMTLPEELADQGLDRAELLIALPPDWKLDHDSLQDERWYWPIRLLKSLARLPGISDTWLGWGHTVDNQEPYADNTELSGAILVVPQQVDEEGFSCQLPGGEEVNFYQLLPLYEDEMEYKIQSGADSLLELYEGTSFIVDPERPNLLAENTPLTQDEIKDLLDRMDDAEWHLQDLREKQLPVEELTAYNHLAIYLRWNLEHGRMSEEFRSRYKELMQQFAADPSGTDLRLFIRDELGGILRHSMFDEEGSAFSSYYYGQNEAPYFPSDIDDYALRRFGPEEYFAEKYQDETYLFIPFDEVYYQDMAQLIQQRWEAWQQYEPSDEEPDELAQATMQYLGCDCEYFPPMRDDDPITAAYSYARRRGMEEGFLPVLVVPSESLWETLILNSDPDSDGAEDYGFDPVRVAKYRKMALSAAPLDGKAILKARMEERIAELEENDIRREEESLGEMEGGEPQDRFLSYWDYDTQRTCPMILAKVPVKQPWEIFAYLPFGGWNDCPDAAELMAVSRTWAEQYGAVPAVLTQDVLEYALPAPVPAEQAMELAIRAVLPLPGCWWNKGRKRSPSAGWPMCSTSRTSGTSGGIDDFLFSPSLNGKSIPPLRWRYALFAGVQSRLSPGAGLCYNSHTGHIPAQIITARRLPCPGTATSKVRSTTPAENTACWTAASCRPSPRNTTGLWICLPVVSMWASM